MARNRVIYQNDGLFVSQFGNSSNVEEHAQLSRIQSLNMGFSVTRQDINQYGQLSRIGTLSIDTPVVNLDFSYYLTDGYNEKALGFYVQDTGSALGFLRFLPRDEDGVNFYILTSDEGVDLNTDTGLYPYIAIGNAFPTDYTLEVSVGAIPTVSVSFEGANILSATMTGANTVKNPSYDISGNPYTSSAVLPDASPLTGTGIPSALRYGDALVTISPTSGSIAHLDPATGLHIQSFSLSVPLGRTALEKLGREVPYARALDFPINAQGSISAIAAETQATNVAEIINSSDSFDIDVTFSLPDNSVAYSVSIKGAKLESESFSSSIGANKSVDLVFSTQVGGILDSASNVFASGSWSSGVYPYDAFLVNNNEVLDASGQLILVGV